MGISPGLAQLMRGSLYGFISTEVRCALTVYAGCWTKKALLPFE
jgi:hypothetical protein